MVSFNLARFSSRKKHLFYNKTHQLIPGIGSAIKRVPAYSQNRPFTNSDGDYLLYWQVDWKQKNKNFAKMGGLNQHFLLKRTSFDQFCLFKLKMGRGRQMKLIHWCFYSASYQLKKWETERKEFFFQSTLFNFKNGAEKMKFVLEIRSFLI